MSESHLPACLDDWPTDPWQVLGVPRNVTPRDLKRAYTGLIKIYKPEQFPQHFRRILDAYEYLRQRGEQRSAIPTQMPANRGVRRPRAKLSGNRIQQARPVISELIIRASSDDVRTDVPSRDDNLIPGGASPDDPDEIWRRLTAGAGADDYHKLLEWCNTHGNPPEASLRLYWLLVARPELDPDRNAVDLLIDAIARGHQNPAIWMTYLRRLASRPDEALTERCFALAQSVSGQHWMMELLEARWQAAAAKQPVEEIGLLVSRDMQGLAPIASTIPEPVQLQSMIRAITFAIWSPRKDVSNHVRAWINWLPRYAHWHAHFGHELAALDFLIELHRGWQKLGSEPQRRGRWRNADGDWPLIELLPLIPRSKILPFTAVRGELEAFLAKIVRDPAQSLAFFDDVFKKAPIVLWDLQSLFNSSRTNGYRSFSSYRDESLVDALREHVQRTARKKYPVWRTLLLQFCLSESVTADEIAAIMRPWDNCQIGNHQHLADVIAADTPLRCVSTAFVAFWQSASDGSG